MASIADDPVVDPSKTPDFTPDPPHSSPWWSKALAVIGGMAFVWLFMLIWGVTS